MKRKLLSIALVFMLLLGMMIPAMTVSAADNGKITITAPANLSLEGQTFKAYKIFDVTLIGSGSNQQYSYQLASAFAGFTYPNSSTMSLSEYIKTLTNNSDAINELAADLWAYIDKNNIAATKSVTATGDTAVIENLPLGYYLVYGTGITDDGVTVVAACALTTTDPDVEITLKADAPTIDKEVWNHNITGTDKWDDWTDVNIGDKLDFRLTSKVPNMTGYTTYTFTVHDTMSAGLTFNDDVVITIGGSIVPTTDYTVIFPATDSHTFDIIFNSAKFVTYTPGADILITYSAILNEDAVIGAPGNPNKVYLEYSNNPYDSNETGKTPDVEVIVYTFDIDIYKYYVDADGKPVDLSGAEFKLYSDENCNVEIPLVNVSEGVYRHALTGETGVVMVSPANGKINIKGLDAGTYYLKETKAPEGFNMLTSAITVVITHDDQKGAYSVWVDDVKVDVINVENKGGVQFPETGGIGRTIFYITGTILTLGAGIVLTVYLQISSKKKTAEAAR